MSERKTTPGPWRLEPVTPGFRTPGQYDAQDLMIIGPNLMCPGIIWDPQGLPEQQANAHLIASAPTMLSALKAMDEALTNEWGSPKKMHSPGDPCPEAWIQIRSAISQADGR